MERDEEVNDCAKWTVDYSQRRKADNMETWPGFTRHSDLNHEAKELIPPSVELEH